MPLSRDPTEAKRLGLTSIDPESYLGKLYYSGRRLRDRYEILKVLGKGGFGVSVLARDHSSSTSQTLCVIKQIWPENASPEAYQRTLTIFQRESKTQALLGRHSQIPSLLAAFGVAGEFYLVQEFIRGKTLRDIVRSSGPWEEAAVKRFLRNLLPLVHFIHSHQVVHRDIKPANLLLSERTRRLTLIDFGAAGKTTPSLQGSELETAGSFVGTLGYAPPEQYSEQLIYASDIYALGGTCLYLLTGKSPLEFEWDYETGEIYWQDAVQVSPSFHRVLENMLQIALPERFQTAEAVLQALNAEPSKPVPQSTPSETYTSPTQRLASRIRQRRCRRPGID